MFKFFASCVLVSVISQVLAEVNDTEKERLQSMPGHLKPFGSVGPFFDVHSMNGFPTVTEFFNGFVAASLPLVMKGAAHISPAYKKWTNEYLLEKAVNDKHVVHVEGRKKEIRTGSTFQMTFKQFVEEYEKKDMYWVNEVPEYLKQDIVLPPPLQCDLVMDNLHTNVMWFSSGGTKSVVHNDDVENINCLLRGNKTLIFVSPFDTDYDWMTNVIDQFDGGYSALDVDAVDFVKYPNLSKMRYGVVNMQAGDCLYIPFRWVHQVNSHGDNLAVNIWFNHKSLDYVDLTPEKCGSPTDVTLDQVNFSTNEAYGAGEDDGLLADLNAGSTEDEQGGQEQVPYEGYEQPMEEEPQSPLIQMVADMRAGQEYDRKKIQSIMLSQTGPFAPWDKKSEKVVEDGFKLLDMNEDDKIDKKDFLLMARSKETSIKEKLKEMYEMMQHLARLEMYKQSDSDKDVMSLMLQRGDVLLPYAQMVYGKAFDQILSRNLKDEL